MKGAWLAVPLWMCSWPASAQEVKVDFDKDVDFSAFKTYGWLESQEPAPNLANHLRITRAVEAELEARGLTRSDAPAADLRVRYTGKVDEKIRGKSSTERTVWPSSPDLRTNVDLKRVKEGTLIIELLDGRSRLRVWRSTAHDTPSAPDRREAQLRELVKKSFEGFPPTPKAE